MLSLLVPLVLLTATPAPAVLCLYNGELYARTTVEQEFADSAWVGRVRVLSSRNNWPANDPNWDGDPWTLYRVEVVETFKGTHAQTLSVFTRRDSGGFYMDGQGAAADVGGEYLLFLNQNQAYVSAEARGAMIVNYSCGQSGPWREVSAADRRTLARLKTR